MMFAVLLWHSTHPNQKLKVYGYQSRTRQNRALSSVNQKHLKQLSVFDIPQVPLAVVPRDEKFFRLECVELVSTQQHSDKRTSFSRSWPTQQKIIDAKATRMPRMTATRNVIFDSSFKKTFTMYCLVQSTKMRTGTRRRDRTTPTPLSA